MIMKFKTRGSYIMAPLLIAFLVLLGSKPINAQEVEDEREFDYARNSTMGPQNWGVLREEWGACNNGTMQSPIDMANERVEIVRNPDRRNYKRTNATIRNRGHDIQIQWTGDAGSLFINGSEFPLRYAHWHSPSEHTVNGRRFAMELHMVHINPETSQIAVVGALYRIGRADKFLRRLAPLMSSLVDGHNETSLGVVHPHEIKMQRNKYYRYIGSLTIPPCTEGVIWTISHRVKTVSREQVHMLRETVHDFAEENARPVQNLHNREVFLYGPGN